MSIISTEDREAFERYRKSLQFDNFPKQWLKQFTESGLATQTKWFERRFMCLKYPLFLGGSLVKDKPEGDESLPDEYAPIMDMDFQQDPHELLFRQFLAFRPGENIVFSDLDQHTKKRMILWPRGIFKTSAVVVWTTQAILNYPNIRICFLTGGDDLAKRQLSRIKRVFEQPTPMFKYLFPDFCLKSVRNKKIQDELDPRAWTDQNCRLGTAHEFTVLARTKDTFAEPTFAISTAKSVKAGSHYDVILIDDLVNEQNYRSVKALTKCYEDYLDVCPLLEPSGFIIMTGTRYSFGDTYERIQEMAREEEKKLGKSIWRFSIRDCWSHGCKNCSHLDKWHDRSINIAQPPCILPGCKCPGHQDNGVLDVLFPLVRVKDGREIGHTVQMLESIRIELGPEKFANQYENNPIALGTQTFTETMIGGQTLFDMNRIPAYSVSTTMAVGDLAYVGQPDRDYSVIYIFRKYQGQLFVYECEFGNWSPSQVAESIVNVIVTHRPEIIYLEKFNGWEAYDHLITTEADRRGVLKVPIEWLKGSQAPHAKLARIGSSQGLLVGKRLWLYGLMKGYGQLVNQLTKWPKLGRHDDFADCLGMVVAAPTGYQLESPPVVESATNWLRRLHGAEMVEDSYGDNGCGTGIVC